MAKILVPLEVPDLFSVREAAKLIGISPATLYRWVKAGKAETLPIAGQRFLTHFEIEKQKQKLAFIIGVAGQQG